MNRFDTISKKDGPKLNKVKTKRMIISKPGTVWNYICSLLQDS